MSERLPDPERVATLEAEMRQVQKSITEIEVSMKALEKIAASGFGALHSSLVIGGIIGGIISILTGLYATFHGR
jgi:hypothetical protein